MAIAYGRSLGTAATAVDGTSLALTTGAVANVGEQIVVIVASKTAASGSTLTITDSAGNTYTVIDPENWSASGVNTFYAIATVTTQLASGGTITIASSVTAGMAARADAWTGLTGTITPSSSISNRLTASTYDLLATAAPASTPYLVLASVGAFSSVVTLTDVSAGYTALGTATTSGGSAARLLSRYKIVTGAPVDEEYQGNLSASVSAMWVLLPLLGAGASQVAVPTADVSAGAWRPSVGATLFATIDEAVAADTDYIYSSSSPATADESKVRLASLTDPAVGTGHTISYRYQKDSTAGDRIDLTVTLYAADGATVIAQWVHTDIGSTVVEADQTLTTTQADSIPSADYATGLVLGFSAIKV